jgi:RNA polymerase sigma-70 factor (ECF subfamily)
MGSLPEALTFESPNDACASADSIIDKYWERAYRFASMISRSDQESADIAQEALLHVIRRLETYDPSKGPFEGWLWKIVLNAARDAGYASIRRAALLDRLWRDAGVVVADDAESLAVSRLTDLELLRAVRRLKPRSRTVIALRFGGQLSYADIAFQLRISEPAAIMATRRALAKLRANLRRTDEQA